MDYAIRANYTVKQVINEFYNTIFFPSNLKKIEFIKLVSLNKRNINYCDEKVVLCETDDRVFYFDLSN